jgi:hypothetical protein
MKALFRFLFIFGVAWCIFIMFLVTLSLITPGHSLVLHRLALVAVPGPALLYLGRRLGVGADSGRAAPSSTDPAGAKDRENRT